MEIKVRGIGLTCGDSIRFFWSIRWQPEPLQMAWLHAKRARNDEPNSSDRKQLWWQAYRDNKVRWRAEEETKVTTVVNKLWNTGYRLYLPTYHLFPLMPTGFSCFFLWQEQPAPIEDYPDLIEPIVLIADQIGLHEALATLPADVQAIFTSLVQEDAWDALIWLSWRSRKWLMQHQHLIPG